MKQSVTQRFGNPTVGKHRKPKQFRSRRQDASAHRRPAPDVPDVGLVANRPNAPDDWTRPGLVAPLARVALDQPQRRLHHDPDRGAEDRLHSRPSPLSPWTSSRSSPRSGAPLLGQLPLRGHRQLQVLPDRGQLRGRPALAADRAAHPACVSRIRGTTFPGLSSMDHDTSRRGFWSQTRINSGSGRAGPIVRVGFR